MKKQSKPPRKKNKGKATAFQSQIRQDTIFKLLLEGRPRRYILEYAGKKWGIGRSMTDEYIARANAVFREQSKFDRNEELSKRVEQLYDLYQGCPKKARFTKLQILKELSRVQSLASIQIDFKGEVSFEQRIEGMTDEELDKTTKEICERLRKAGINIKFPKKTGPTKGSGK